MTTQTIVQPPSCPACNEDDKVSDAVLIEHGYFSCRVTWDDAIGDWTTNREDRLYSWNGDESYWQCPDCGWQGDDPIGLDPDDRTGGI